MVGKAEAGLPVDTTFSRRVYKSGYGTIIECTVCFGVGVKEELGSEAAVALQVSSSVRELHNITLQNTEVWVVAIAPTHCSNPCSERACGALFPCNAITCCNAGKPCIESHQPPTTKVGYQATHTHARHT